MPQPPLSVAFVVFFAFYVNYALCDCAYSDGRAPHGGSCTGPMERALAKRAHADYINRGCGLQKVFSPRVVSDDEVYLQCGECIPGSSGNDRFNFKEVTKDVSSYYVWTSLQGIQYQYEIEKSEIVPLCSCTPNYYCSSYGHCKSMTSSDWYLKSCKNGECGDGLVCISEKCVICDERFSDLCIDGQVSYSKFEFSYLRSRPKIVIYAILIIVSAAKIIGYTPVGAFFTFVNSKFRNGVLRREEVMISEEDADFLDIDDDLYDFYVMKKPPDPRSIWYVEFSSA